MLDEIELLKAERKVPEREVLNVRRLDANGITTAPLELALVPLPVRFFHVKWRALDRGDEYLRGDLNELPTKSEPFLS